MSKLFPKENSDKSQANGLALFLKPPFCVWSYFTKQKSSPQDREKEAHISTKYLMQFEDYI